MQSTRIENYVIHMQILFYILYFNITLLITKTSAILTGRLDVCQVQYTIMSVIQTQ